MEVLKLAKIKCNVSCRLFMMLYKVNAVRNVRMGLIWDDKCGQKKEGVVTIYYSLYTAFYWGETART